MAWIINSETLEYGPRYVDYVLVSGQPRSKFISNETRLSGATPNSYSFKPDFPIYSMTWPIVTSATPIHGGDHALYVSLSSLPLNKTITFHEGVSGLDFNIQILDRLVENIKTVSNGEVLRSVTLKFRFI